MNTVTGLGSLTLQLTRGRFASRQGETLLYFASILACAVSSVLALTVLGGTMMLHRRWVAPPPPLAEVVAVSSTIDTILMIYFVLGLVALALLLPAMISLSASAAVLGARGREQRLSALRLLGLSSGDVTRMSLLDSLIQSVIGTTFGLLLYLATVPLWAGAEIEGIALTHTDLHLPWWMSAVVCLTNVLISLIATWWGLRQVRISPLGVARQAAKPKVTWLRAVVFVTVVIGLYLGMQRVRLGHDIWGFLLMAGACLLIVAVFNLAGPWVLQSMARSFARLPGTTVLLATRRIQADARATWRQVGGLGFLALIGGFVATMPIQVEVDTSGAELNFAEATRWDFTKGVIVMLIAGLILTSTAMLITQASEIFERSELTLALHRIGAPASFHTRVMWVQNLGPLVVVLGIGYLLGFGMAYPVVDLARRLGIEPELSSTWALLGVLVGGFLLAVLSLAVVQPLQRQVLGTQRRRND